MSYRDLEQMMAERDVSVDHSTIYRWIQTYAPEIEKRRRWQWRGPHSSSLPRSSMDRGWEDRDLDPVRAGRYPKVVEKGRLVW